MKFNGFQHLVHQVFFRLESYLKCKFYNSLIHPLVNLLRLLLNDDVTSILTMTKCHVSLKRPPGHPHLPQNLSLYFFMRWKFTN